MNRLFFIGGLPRSGTAWTSALISLCPNAFCLHEGEALYRQKLVSALMNRSEKFVGDSAPLAISERFDEYTASRVAIIRNKDQVKESSRIAFYGRVSEQAIDNHHLRLMRWISIHNPLVVQFEDLFTVEGASAVWHHVLGKEYFPINKVAALCRTRVEQIIPGEAELDRMITNFKA